MLNDTSVSLVALFDPSDWKHFNLRFSHFNLSKSPLAGKYFPVSYLLCYHVA